MSFLEVRNLSKSFPTPAGPLRVLENIDLTVERGEFVTIFGPNGCGKSTFINIIGGIEPADSGTVRMELSARTKMAIVPQDFRSSLLPWLTVRNNILFPLRLQHMARESAAEKLDGLVTRLGIAINPDARAYTLSGGQAQWVCLLRALVTEPELVILDEPFSALDFQTCMTLRDKLLEIWKRLGLTCLMISHDLDEALYLADRTVFMRPRPGRIAEILPSSIPRPRHTSVLTSIEFAQLKALALAAFERCLTTT